MIRPRLLEHVASPRPRSPRPFSRWRTAFRPGGPPFNAAAPPLPGTGTDLGRWPFDHVVVVVPVRHRPRLRERDGALALLAPGDGCLAGGPRRTIARHPTPLIPSHFAAASDRRHRPPDVPLRATLSQGVRVLPAFVTPLQRYHVRGSTPFAPCFVDLGNRPPFPIGQALQHGGLRLQSRRIGAPPSPRPRETQAEEPPPEPS